MVEEQALFNKPLNILIVEDNPIDRKVLESMLLESPHLGTSLKSVPSLILAIKNLDSTPYDIVILDLNLPDSKGLDTLIDLNLRFPQVPIVVNTGAYEDNIGIRALRHGAQDFLVKGKYTSYVLSKTLRYAMERKRLQGELIKTHKKLRETEAQLIHAEKMKVIGALASGVAHEVKNPLAVILYGVTYLEQHLQSPDDQVSLVMRNIKDAVHRADVIVNDLLDFSSLTRLNMKQEDVNQILDKSLQLIKHEIERKHIGVEKHLKDLLPVVEMDRQRIEQVLINLMLNAIQAMNKGGRLFLTTDVIKVQKGVPYGNDFIQGPFKPGEKIVVICVEDTGPGISDENLSKIFEPFFTTKRGLGGIGLGLAVSKNIMQIHDGYIHLENRMTGGAKALLAFKAN